MDTSNQVPGSPATTSHTEGDAIDYPSNDPDEFRQKLAELRVALYQVDLLVKDMLRPIHARESGPATHRKYYKEFRAEINRLVGIPTVPKRERGQSRTESKDRPGSRQ